MEFFLFLPEAKTRASQPNLSLFLALGPKP
jgi:hypothetical protein